MVCSLCKIPFRNKNRVPTMARLTTDTMASVRKTLCPATV